MAEVKAACSGGPSSPFFNIVLEYFEGTPDQNGNYSPCTINLYVEPNQPSWFFYGFTITGRIYVDNVLRREQAAVPDLRNGRCLIASWSENVYHEESGDKAFNISAELIGPGEPAIGYGSTAVWWTLTKIYRGSVLGDVQPFMFDAQENIGVEFSVPTTRYVEAYKDKLTIKIGNDIVATRNEYTSGKVTFSEDELKVIYSKMNTNTVQFTFVLQTFNDQTKIGIDSVKYVKGTLSEIDRAPTFTDFSWENIDQKTLSLAGSNKRIVQGQSNIEISINNVQKAVGRKGAIIVKYIATIGLQTAETNDLDSIATIVINNVDNPVITVFAVDNRGNSSVVTKAVTNFIYYVPITKNNLVCSRSENGIGKIVTLDLEGSFSNVDFGLSSNAIKSIVYKYRITGTDAWITGNTQISATVEENNYKLNQVISGDLGANGFSQDKSFEIYVEIHDKLTVVSDTFILSAGSPAIALYGNCVALGAPYDEKLGGRVQIMGRVLEPYPIGAIYLSVNDTDPSELFGGTWEFFGAGRTLVGVDYSIPEFNQVEKMGGETAHQLVLNEIPDQVLSGYCAPDKKSWSTGNWYDHSAYNYPTNTIQYSGVANGNQPHNNLQPYITCYMWKRVA